MQEEKYIIATALIDGDIKEFYRSGKKEGFYTYPQYSDRDIEYLRKEIFEQSHLIRRKINRLGYFYSDDYGFCRSNFPEVICEILKKEFDINFNFGYEKSEFIIFTDKIDGFKAKELFYKHFNK